ncbi:MAG: protein-disulfide reductase DsbD domain-containing protein [Bryobacteraceae bacterium]
MKEFGLQPDDPGTSIHAKHLQLGTSISDQETSMGQHVALILDVRLSDRVHVYAPGVKGYVPIDWELAPSAGIKAGPVRYPKSQILRLEAIQESVPVYEGEFRLSRNVTIGSVQAVTPLLDAHGNLTIAGTFRYQACDDQKCFLPETVPVRWIVHFRPLDRERVPEDMQQNEH